METTLDQAAKRLFSLSEAARRCEVLRTTIRAAVDRGEIPCVEMGSGERYVALAAVRMWKRKSKTRRPGRKAKT